jgi:guanine deaminase
MQLAIAKAQEGIAAGQTPFGTVIARTCGILAATHNSVWRDGDPTAHAEINAIREAARTLGSINLCGCTLYSTCEPCPMCLSAIHWSKIDRMVYGATIADAAAAGFTELYVAAAQLAALGGSKLRVEAGPLRAECADLFRQWQAAGLSAPY